MLPVHLIIVICIHIDFNPALGMIHAMLSPPRFADNDNPFRPFNQGGVVQVDDNSFAVFDILYGIAFNAVQGYVAQEIVHRLTMTAARSFPSNSKAS